MSENREGPGGGAKSRASAPGPWWRRLARPAATPETRLFQRRGAFFVTAGGAGAPSALAGRDASYWDWGFMRYVQDGVLTSHMRGGQRDGLVTLLVDGQEIALRVNQLRLYLSPVFRQPVAHGDRDLAPAVSAWLDRYNHTLDQDYVIEEYVLERGERYHAVVRLDHYWLPLVGALRHPATNPILHLSDRPFDELPADEEPIPAFRGFTY